MRNLMKIMLCLLLTAASVSLTGCTTFSDIKPVPIAEGHDALIVNAERIQTSSLEIFQLVTKWELDNRAVLPAEVSRAVDKYRKEFPPAWRESRRILSEYKFHRGTTSNQVQQVTAFLQTVEGSLLRLRQNQNPNQVTQAVNSLTRFVEAIQAIRKSSPASTK